MADNSVAHIYGIGGVIPGLVGLGLAWGIDSPWSEYALMASGWIAAIIYAILIWKIVRNHSRYAQDYGSALSEISSLQKEIDRLQTQHAKEMEQRANTMELLAGMAMGQRPIPRSLPKEGLDDGE